MLTVSAFPLQVSESSGEVEEKNKERKDRERREGGRKTREYNVIGVFIGNTNLTGTCL